MAGKDNIWEKLADRHFVRTADGRVAYYSGWPRRVGYWIDSDARERALRRSVRRQLWPARIVVPALPILPWFFPPDERGWSVAFLIGFYLLWAAEEYWQLRRLTRGLAIAPPRSVSGTTPDEPKLPYLQRSALMISTRFLLLQCLVFGPIFVYAAHFMIRTGNIGVGSIASAVVLILFPAWATVMLVTKLWMRWIGGEPSVAEAQLAQENKLGMQAYLRMLRPAWILVALLFLLGLAAAFVG